MADPITIDEFYVFIVIQESGNEDVMILNMPETGPMPMICSSMEQVEQIRPAANVMAQKSGRPFKIKHFILEGEI